MSLEPTDLAFLGLAAQADRIASGAVSAREVVDATLERIERHDGAVNAYRVVFAERARTEADQADARRRAGDARPLLGVPVALKDDVDVAGEVTGMGIDGAGAPASADAEAVRRLRAAGAVIVGKTHVPELAITPFTETPTYGKTRNPWDLQRTPGGSSGGAAAAVAAGMAGGALGSDGAGSIRIPAGCCGLFGLKPQRDRIPMAPQRDRWCGLAVLGPLTRTVADAARLLDALADAGPDPSLGTFAQAAAREPGRLRIALSTKVPAPVVATVAPDQLAAVESVAEILRALGHDVVVRDPDYGTAGAAVLARYLRGVWEAAQAIERPERLARQTRGWVRLGGLVPAALVARLRAREAADAARYNAILAPGECDLILTPTFTRATLRIGEYEGRSALATLQGTSRWVPHLAIVNHTGQPAAAIPAGFGPDGLPRSVHLVARAGDERTLLSVCTQIETARPWAAHRPPMTP